MGSSLPVTLLVTSRVPELGVPTKGARAARETFAWVCNLNLAAKPSLDAKRLSGPSGDPHGHGHGC